MPQLIATPALEREQLRGVVGKLMVDLNEFFAQQQNALQLSYAELNSRVDQLRMRIQHPPSQQGSPLHSGNGVYTDMNASPFSAIQNVAGADLLGVSGAKTGVLGSSSIASATQNMNATPLRPAITGGAARSLMSSLNGNSAMLAVGEVMSEPGLQSGAGMGYLASANNHATVAGLGTFGSHKADPVTPLNTHLALSQPVGRSPCLHPSQISGVASGLPPPLDDSITGDYFSTAPNRNNRSQQDSLTASPQATQKLSLEDLIKRFSMSSAPGATATASSFNFDSLYEQLTAGGLEESSQSPVEYESSPVTFSTSQTRNAFASLYDRRSDNGTTVNAEASALGSSSSNSVKNGIPVDTLRSLHDQHLTTSVKAVEDRGRPKVVRIAGAPPDTPEKLGIDPKCSCEVLVEFKRKRVLQYESTEYVAPGSYVIVGGDRGEDLGLVVYVWCEVAAEGSPIGDGTPGSCHEKGSAGSRKLNVIGVGLTDSRLPRNLGVGNGTVLRLASETDVQQLLGTQAELERRAIDVCAQLVLDHSLPMVIIDAEYQFDKKKLTFFYEAQQRMDFRELVRHLYKTFRARIWMELVDL